MIDQQLKQYIREINDFPKKGISFKDITPLFKAPSVSNFILDSFVNQLSTFKVDAVVGIESRGFIYAFALANRLKVPFIPIRKKGKLPFSTISQDYELEYGNETLEIHTDAIKKEWNVVVHDDLLATGGTAEASAKLIEKLDAKVCAFTFVVELSFLNGTKTLNNYCNTIISLTKYNS